MVAPVTGPVLDYIVRTIAGNGFAVLDDSKIGWRQKPPYDLSLPYRRIVCSGSFEGNFENAGPGCSFYHPWNSNTEFQRSINITVGACVEKLRGEVTGASASVGEDLGEMKQSIEMIHARATQLVRVVGRIRKFDFLGAARLLGLKKAPNGVSRRKTVADNYLEYHYGWEPLVKDIYSGTEICAHALEYVSLRPISATKSDFVTTDSGVYGDYPTTWGRLTENCSVKVRMGAAIRITNPDAVLAQDLGLLNPVSIAWNLVPSSFVADWYANIGSFLDNLSRWAGVDLINPWFTTKFECDSIETLFNLFWDGPLKQVDRSFQGVATERVLDIPNVTLSIRPVKVPSKVRAVTALALLAARLR